MLRAVGAPVACFAESVVLLVRHGPDGSMGLVANRPTDMPLRDALKEVEQARGSRLKVYRSGAVQPEAILALVRTRSPSPRGHPERIERSARAEDPRGGAHG